MSKALTLSALLALVVSTVPLAASAHPPRPHVLPGHVSARAAANIEERLQTQQARIDAGMVDGSLTRGEARALHRDQRRIRRELAVALRDGFLSRGEFARIDWQLDRASKRIFRLRHNRQVSAIVYRPAPRSAMVRYVAPAKPGLMLVIKSTAL